MKLIEKLSDMIEEEMDDAEKYIKCAMNYKEDYPTLASTFYKLSAEEMGHMSMLHDQVTQIINEWRKANGDPPEKMLAIYDYLHKKHIERANEIKIMQSLFKG